MQKVGKGMIQGVVAYCDECKYGWNVSLQYAVGTNAPYKPKMPKTEEVVKFDPRATATKTAEGGQ